MATHRSGVRALIDELLLGAWLVRALARRARRATIDRPSPAVASARG